MVNNNLRGIELEKEGKTDEAINLYEENISKNFDGNGPYDRLAIIYRKRKEYDSEIRVLNHAIEVFSKLSKTSPRGDIKPKLEKFKQRLEKAISLRNKEK
jgi:tetratricopeptide (TPR) repeat protein